MIVEVTGVDNVKGKCLVKRSLAFYFSHPQILKGYDLLQLEIVSSL